MRRYYHAVMESSNYWKLRIIQRGARGNLPTYSLNTDKEVKFTSIYRIAEGVWESKVAKALYA